MLMENGVDIPRFTPTHDMHAPSNALDGKVTVSSSKLLWVSSMYAGTLAAVIFYFSLTNLLVFLVLTATVLCFGHSLGMHRRLIHKSFGCPLWLEYSMVYLGTLVGLAGPFGMIYTHDLRDWAQRQDQCHDYFAHRRSFWRDAWWQLFCDIRLKNAPKLAIEDDVSKSRFYQFIDRTWMWQQAPISILLYATGGVEWVLWGTCARVSACVTGHWLIGHFAHRQGHREWHVEGAGVQGYNIKFCGLITFGECWHNNHHAFPASARIGLHANQSDPGWWVINAMEKLGLAWNVQTPETIAKREELRLLKEA